MSEVGGWAVRDENGISIKTISDTRRAAIVNWLVVSARLVVSSDSSDAGIEAAWLSRKGGAEVIQVLVRAIKK